MDVVRMCGHDCSVIINSVAPPLRADLEFLRLIHEDFKRMSTEESDKSTAPVRHSLKRRRADKQVLHGLVGLISCLNCTKPEPEEVKFRACGKFTAVESVRWRIGKNTKRNVGK